MAHGEEVRLNFDEYVTEKSRIGIVLKDGTKSDLNACAFSSSTLIDLQISDGGQGVLKNCRFSDSTEESLILRGSGEMEVRNCDFQRCSAGIALAGNGTNAKILDSRFTECGVGVKLLDRSSATLTQCRFERNKTAGLFVMRDSETEVSDCVFQAQET
ncbi:MAG: right-handed parallel beta-helix repeat-containing protein [Thermoguttaceae bacterium]|nr:right-handed parallel beta-helix repeat-containing protein [Thermoguttaceae bacterium]